MSEQFPHMVELRNLLVTNQELARSRALVTDPYGAKQLERYADCMGQQIEVLDRMRCEFELFSQVLHDAAVLGALGFFDGADPAFGNIVGEIHQKLMGEIPVDDLEGRIREICQEMKNRCSGVPSAPADSSS